MRNMLILTIVLLMTSTAIADCRVFIPEKEFLHDSGYSIRFDFTKMLTDKKYTEVSSPEMADYILTLGGLEQESRIHRAVTRMEMGEVRVEESVACFTQNCGISDFAKSFNRSYKKLAKKLLDCY